VKKQSIETNFECHSTFGDGLLGDALADVKELSCRSIPGEQSRSVSTSASEFRALNRVREQFPNGIGQSIGVERRHQDPGIADDFWQR